MPSPRYGYGVHLNTATKRIYIRAVKHPYANKGGYVLLSHLIVEQFIGRYLKPSERVHHRDHNPYNEAPDNLRLYPNQSAHARMHGLRRILNPGLKQLKDRKWLEYQYITLHKSVTGIAKELKCCHVTVINHLNDFAISRRKHTMTPEALAARIKGARAKKPRRKKLRKPHEKRI